MADSDIEVDNVAENVRFWFQPEAQLRVEIEEVARVLEEVRRRLAGAEFAKTLIRTGMMVDIDGDIIHPPDFDPDDPGVAGVIKELEQHIEAYQRVIAICISTYQRVTSETV